MNPYHRQFLGCLSLNFKTQKQLKKRDSMKNTNSWWKTGLVVASVCLFAVGCREAGQDTDTAQAGSAADSAQASTTLSYEDFKAQAFQDPNGGFIVNGDEHISNEKKLREFHKNYFEGKTAAEVADSSRSIVHTSGGSDVVWSETQKKNLTYCISTDFGSNYDTVVADIASATGAWETQTDIDFIHDSSQDGNCTKTNNNVLFDVNPVNVNGQYLARAFFPDDSRGSRNVLIDNSSFDLSGNLTLTGILRHELGHVLGLRHEHTRPESGTCFEDNNWRALTSYDSDSVMHYPQCNGTGDWSLTLTASDKTGIKALYDDSTGGGNGGGGNGGGDTGVETTSTTTDSVSRRKWKHYYVDAESGTTVNSSITGTGDADLYVRVGSQPTSRNYDCRPYANGSTESCSVNVGSSDATVYSSVYGYSASTFTLSITWTPAQ